MLFRSGKFVDLYRGRSREPIHSFPNSVTAEEMEKYVLGYEADLKKKIKKMKLKEYCEAPMSFCLIADYNCDDCKFPHKDEALQRKREGKKVVRPGRKKGGLMEATEERNVLLKQTKNKENKETFSKRNFTGKWR